MKKFEDVDVIDSLRRIMNVNTKHYKSDFVYDAEKIRAAAVGDKSEDNTLLFMSRENGTYCFRERDVFIRGSSQHNTWRHYGEQNKDNILAYAVKITGIVDGVIKGNLYELDYQKHYRHVIGASVRADNEAGIYDHGQRVQPKGKDFPKRDAYYGELKTICLVPNRPDELKYILDKEHRQYERLSPADIDAHISKLETSAQKPSIRKQLESGKKETAKTKPKPTKKKEEPSI